jgi:curved DNA-binding protein CbpA
MNAFESLGLEVCLVISSEEIRDAFRARAAAAHPDGGGDEAEFAALREAREVLESPAKRLREWLRANGIEADARGSITGELADFFQRVAETGAEAEAAIKAAAGAQSALAKGMAEVRLMGAREKAKSLLSEIEAGIDARVALFPDIEAGESDAGTAMRDLVFLEKWRGSMRSLYGRLI